LSKDIVWAIENIRKYPDPEKGKQGDEDQDSGYKQDEWVLVDKSAKDLLSFI
jgi:hypothetical protein